MKVGLVPDLLLHGTFPRSAKQSSCVSYLSGGLKARLKIMDNFTLSLIL